MRPQAGGLALAALLAAAAVAAPVVAAPAPSAGCVETGGPGVAAALTFARCLGDAGATRAAREAAEAATERFADAAPAWFLLADLAWREARSASIFRAPGLARKGRAAAERASHLDPANLLYPRALVVFHLKAPAIAGGSRSEARRIAASLLARAPRLGHYLEGLIALGAGGPGDAAAAFRQALAEPRDEALARDGALAAGELEYQFLMLEVARGAFAEAWAEIDRLDERAQREPLVQYAIARLAAASGERRTQGQAAIERFLAAPAGTPEWAVKGRLPEGLLPPPTRVEAERLAQALGRNRR